MSDEFALIERDEDGNPTISRWLDPREVSIVRDEHGGVRGYVWEPEQLERLDPASRANPRLIDCGCRHCRNGRMCREMAEMYRRCSREDGRMIQQLMGRVVSLREDT